MRRPPAPYRSDANDPGCVKTHTSAKCRKHNSPARHRASRVEYDLTLRDAIARRYFYVWRDRWSFRTAKTPQQTFSHRGEVQCTHLHGVRVGYGAPDTHRCPLLLGPAELHGLASGKPTAWRANR